MTRGDRRRAAEAPLVLSRVEFSWERGGRSWLDLPAWFAVPALLAVALDQLGAIDAYWAGLPVWLVPVIGGIPVSPAVPLGLAVFLFGASRALPWPRGRPVWRWWLVAAGVALGLALASWVSATRGDPAGLTAVVVEVASEEGIYRIALPWLIAAGLSRWGSRGVWAGFLVSSIVFTLLPGHTSQYAGGGGLAVFGLFGLLACVVTWDVVNPWPMYLVHLVVDLLSLSAAGSAFRHGLAMAGSPLLVLCTGVALLVVLWRRMAGDRRLAAVTTSGGHQVTRCGEPDRGEPGRAASADRGD
ncbi:MAG: CPBP family glutamic-type intramembrane protease, partial [Candidatus Dormibacteria bacterium]